MNTTASHHSYGGSEHGLMGRRDAGPGALLDMLAEVASQTLHSESIKADRSSVDESPEELVHQFRLNLPRILSMNLTQLVKQFSVRTTDPRYRRFTYTCAIMPGCQQHFTSWNGESKARISITMHLAEHCDRFRNNLDIDGTYKATPVKTVKPKSTQTKKLRNQRTARKPLEIPNKENKNGKAGKSTSYLRKILSSEMNFKDFERQKRADEEKRCPVKNPEPKVLGDHSYYEHAKEDTIGDSEITEAMSENIMLMVVESDGVRIKELASISDDSDQAAAPSKPKGKAKFIGTSKEEREKALVLMERIKKKGHPIGASLQCRICDPPRSFTAPTTLVSHYRSHAGIKPYECRICRSVFTRRHSLKYHMLIHQNQTRFTCGDCGKKFRHPSHFREHRRRHTGESPFGCDDCGQRFKTRNTYKRHLKTRHGKVLTTSGELLCLTEEELQKAQTNRKRKSHNSSSESQPANTRVVDDITAENNETETGSDLENCIIYDMKEESMGLEYSVENRSTEERLTNGESLPIEEDSGNSVQNEYILPCEEYYEGGVEPVEEEVEAVEEVVEAEEVADETGEETIVGYPEESQESTSEISEFRLDQTKQEFPDSMATIAQIPSQYPEDAENFPTIEISSTTPLSTLSNPNNNNNNNETFIVLTNDDFKPGYLGLEENGTVVVKETLIAQSQDTN